MTFFWHSALLMTWLTFLGLPLHCWLLKTFLGFRLECFPRQTDLNQLMTQAVSRILESIQIMTQAAFQELTQNQLMTQVDSQVLIQIDSWFDSEPYPCPSKTVSCVRIQPLVSKTCVCMCVWGLFPVVFPRHVARISSRRGPTWRGPRVPPTKDRKLLGFGPLFFGSGPIYFLFSFFYYKISFYFPLRGAGHGPLAPPPLATSLVFPEFWIWHSVCQGS